MPYLLVCSPSNVTRGRYTVAHNATIYVVTDAQLATAAHSALFSANVAVQSPEEAESHNGAGVHANHLYRADYSVATELLRALELACPGHTLLHQEVIVKLPNLVENSADALDTWSEEQSHTAATSTPTSTSDVKDNLLCMCPLGLCDAVCSNCDVQTQVHQYELAALQRQARKIVTALKIEGCAEETLTERSYDSEADELPQLLRQLTYTSLVSVQLAFARSKATMRERFPALEPLLNRAWPVHLSAGVALADAVEYANRHAAMPPTLDQLGWSPRRLRAATELFDWLVANPRRIEFVIGCAEQQIKSLWDVALMWREGDSSRIFVKHYSRRALERFASKPVSGLDLHTDDRGEAKLALPLVRLVNLSACAYLGDPYELDSVDHMRSLAGVAVPLPGREDWCLKEDDEDDPELPWLDHHIRYDVGEFIRTWIRPGRNRAAPSAAPKANSVSSSAPAGPNLPGTSNAWF